MAKIADASSVSAGDQAGFTVPVTNNGTRNAYDVSAAHNLPGGTVWSISGPANGWAVSSNVLTYGPATLAAGASASVHVVTTTDKTECPNLHNAATFRSEERSVGKEQADSGVHCRDESIAKIAQASSVAHRNQAGFTVSVSNNGTGNAYDGSATNNLRGWTV